MLKAIIAAVADDGAIGKDNALLWHIAEDMRYFKATTLGAPVIMGFRTFASLGMRALPRRRNIVISTHEWADVPQGIEVVRSLDEAYAVAADGAEIATSGSALLAMTNTALAENDIAEQKCFVIGGGKVYREAIESADMLYITHVYTKVPDADTFFPEIDPREWAVESRSERKTDPENGLQYEFVVYRRARNELN